MTAAPLIDGVTAMRALSAVVISYGFAVLGFAGFLDTFLVVAMLPLLVFGRVFGGPRHAFKGRKAAETENREWLVYKGVHG